MLASNYQNKGLEAGCDEAGRGCLAGPVFAAAVILPPQFHHPLLNDSKKMKEKDRYVLRDVISKEAISWAVASIDSDEIDKINILQASFKAMHASLDQLSKKPDLILVDGHLFNPYNNIPHICMVKGDARFASIAAASVLAKTFRDDYMLNIDTVYPEYGWRGNKGYGTANHREAIYALGLTPFHRKTFQLKAKQQAFDF
jgi:ribonuclease HII